MSETRTLELRVKDNANEVQQQFENLRQQIAKTTQEVDELTQAYGENSQEVTAAKNKLTELTTSYKELNKSATDTGATFANVYGEIQPLTTRMGEAEDRLYELAAAGKTASKEYQDLLQTTQNYLRIQQSVDLQVEAGAVPAAQKMTMAVGGVAGAFGVAEGAAALFGVESAKLQETMVRLQAAMTITQGLTTIREAIPTFTAMGNAAKQALSGIRTGILATGIGVFVVALGTIVAYWDDIRQAVFGVSKEQQELNKKTAKNLEIADRTLSDYENQNNVLKLQGKTDEEILKGKIKLQKQQVKFNLETFTALENQTKAEKAASKTREKYLLAQFEMTKFFIGLAFDLVSKPINYLIEQANSLSEELGFGKLIEINAESAKKSVFETVDSVKSMYKTVFEGIGVLADEKTLDKTLADTKSKLLVSQNELAASELELRQMGIDANASSASQNVNIAAGAAQEQIDITRQMEEEKNRLMEEGRAKDLDALRIKYKYEKQEADKNLKENKLSKENYDKLIKQQVESLELDTKAINDKYDKIERDARDLKLQEQIKAEDAAWLELQNARNSQREQELLDLQLAYDAKIEAANGNAEAEKAITERFNKDYAAINKKYADEEAAKKKEQDEKEKARIKTLNEYRVKAIEDSLQMVSDLAELFAGKSEKQQKKAFQVQKAVNIATAVVDTYKAANTALASSPPPFNYIAMAAAITAGLLNVKKIASQQFQTSGTPPSSNTNAPAAAPMTANFNTIGSSGINQLAQLQQTPTQAYVVSGEVTSAQALDRNRVQNATL
jgi:hypothetical protein